MDQRAEDLHIVHFIGVLKQGAQGNAESTIVVIRVHQEIVAGNTGMGSVRCGCF